MMIPQYDVALSDFVDGWSSRQIWGRLAWQEIKRRYRRTTIGPLWTTLSLGIFISVLGVVWAGLWGQNPKTYLPFLCAGMLAWNLVQSMVVDGCQVFVGGETFIKQMRFPYSMLVWALVCRNLILFAHHIVIFIAIAVYAGVPVTPASVLVIPGLVLVALNGAWMATLLGVICARYRDVQQVMTSIMQISMFVTPIFFTRDQLGPRFNRVTDFNILFHYVDIIRSPLLGRLPALWSWVMVAAVLVAGWSLTFWFYSRFRRRVPYWL